MSGFEAETRVIKSMEIAVEHALLRQEVLKSEHKLEDRLAYIKEFKEWLSGIQDNDSLLYFQYIGK